MAWGGDAVADGVEGFRHGAAMELRSMTATGVISGVPVLYFVNVGQSGSRRWQMWRKLPGCGCGRRRRFLELRSGGADDGDGH